MKLRNFLIVMGLWVAILSHVGFSIATENILFSITGFILILASFYISALEDRHGKNRIVKDGEVIKTTQQNIHKKLHSLNIAIPSRKKNIETQESKEQPPEEIEPQTPKIRKAVSDVKINTSEIDARDDF